MGYVKIKEVKMTYSLTIYYLDGYQGEIKAKTRSGGEFPTLEDAEAERNNLLKMGFKKEAGVDFTYYPPHSIIKMHIVRKES